MAAWEQSVCSSISRKRLFSLVKSCKAVSKSNPRRDKLSINFESLLKVLSCQVIFLDEVVV